MDISGLQEVARQTRSMREIGIGLLIASVLLAAFIFVPLIDRTPEAPVAAVATTTAPNPFATVQAAAKAAIVYDLATGETLYEKNADAQLPLASLTKLLTVYAALAELAPNTPITISENAAEYDAPRVFRAGQVLSLSDISRLTLTASLNDGAAAIIEATSERQNLSEHDVLARAASSLNLAQTFAVNGSGLDESESISGGYGSARDMARLAGALVAAAPSIAAATTESTAEAVSEGGTKFNVKNTDPIVDTVAHLLLSKTGYTDLAGGNLALVFDVGINHPIAVVVLGSSLDERFTDSSALIAATHAHFAGVASL